MKRDDKFRFSVRCDAAGFVISDVSEDLITFKTLGTINLATDRHIAEEMNPPKHRCENHKCCNREDEEKAERKSGIQIRKGKQKHIGNNITNQE
jgi:hypothetical protein